MLMLLSLYPCRETGLAIPRDFHFYIVIIGEGIAEVKVRRE